MDLEKIRVHFSTRTLQAFDEGKCVVVVFIDFRKAVDTINRKMLLQKLKDIGFDGIVFIK